MRPFFTLSLALPATLVATTFSPLREPKSLEGSWIVQLKQGADMPDILTQLFEITKIQPTNLYSIGDFQALSLDGVSDQIISLVLALTAVESIESNSEVYTTANITQPDAPWNLARISHRSNTAIEYIYDETAGAGSCTYVVDTGIYTEHPEFKGRAIWGINLAGDDLDTDANGHGTHVAGTIGAATFGVAKGTLLLAVKVLDATGSGTTANVLKGIEWAVNDSLEREGCGNLSVINLSLGSPYSPAVNTVVAEAVKAGVFVAVSAGNSGVPTSTASPASAPQACTVGATDSDDFRADFSNWGSVVDLFAPGVNVTSTWSPDSVYTPGTVATISGTSMASPHVVGLAAYLQGLDGGIEAGRLCETIQWLSTKGVAKNPFDLPLLFTKNYLAYNGVGVLQRSG
ncbi:subtilase [Bimuria novae-zelandiae CBS 107.79]|uniref:Subtilase n=1 Tax=Bimuria novae-zelandiae CBS 107.79 TaxID=1447943 RepID=A0A6A5VH78_9PLEO|nr:subtilase [Bimuria novae-zelandiae CBS 107.79]